MGNFQRWAGPPSDEWIDAQKQLGRNILQRMNSLGMEPILPGFAGFLPDSFVTQYPKAQYQKLSNWSGFKCEYSCIVWLEPSDRDVRTLTAVASIKKFVGKVYL